MAEEKRITCINKPDRHDATKRITHVGNQGAFSRAATLLTGEDEWKMTLDEAIDFIKRGNRLYVMEANQKVYVVIAGPKHAEYLTTHPDDTTKNNLLSLPECR